MILWNSVLELVFAHTFFTALTSHSNDTSTEVQSSSATKHLNISTTNSIKIRRCLVSTLNETHATDSSQVYDDRILESCGENMKCYNVSSDRVGFGECDCDFSSQRMLVYHNKTNRCYEVFKQGPCKPGKWVDVNKDGKPGCRRKLCDVPPESGGPGRDIVKLKNGTCVEVGGQCGDKKVVRFIRGWRLPFCVSSNYTPRGRAIGVIRHRCSPGTYRAISGQCQPPFVFDFD